ncbi:MAG: class I adenylate-forming enzyme family protein [Reyranellaceae bacterium]
MNASDNVAAGLHRWATSTPGQLALIEQERTVTYAELDRAVWRACAGLRQAGLQAGAVVAMFGDGGSLLQLTLSLALARMGAIQVALSLAERPERLRMIAQTAGIAAVVSSVPGIEKFGPPVIRPDPAWLDPAAPAEIGDPGPGGNAIWLINHSSGTTGRPKAMAISHAMEAARMALQPPEFACRPGERFMSMTSFEFWIGRSRAIRCLSEGATVVAAPQTTDTAEIIAAIARHDVTHLTCTPVHLHQILEHLPQDGLRFPRLRMVRVSSAALPERVLTGIRARMSPHVYTNYGANEAGNFSVATPDMLAQHPDTVGKPAPGVDFELVDERGRRVGVGETGHVRVRSPGMIQGYVADREATAAAFRDGWFYPGDLATIDADGLVFLKGRSDDMLNVEGMLVSPEEIEKVLREHPAVSDAAAFRLPSERHQDVPAAAVVIRDGTSPEDIRSYCVRRLGMRSPAVVLQLPQLPRNRIGKVLRKELTRLTMEALEQRDGKSA